MLRRFRDAMWKKARAKTTKRGKPVSVRPTVECLEVREVLSTAMPVLALTDGNLYNNAGGSQQLLDTSVGSFAMSPQGKVIVLETNGNLYSFDPMSGGHIFLDSPVTAFAVSPQGRVIETESNGNLYSFDPLTGGHIFLDSPVTAFAVSPQGKVIETETNGNLYSFDPLTGGHIFLDSPVTAFAISPQGQVIETETNGNLYSFDPVSGGHIFLDSPVAAFAVSPQGRVIETETNGNLYSFDPLTGGHIFLDSPVTAFAVSPQGKVIETETNGNLYSFDPLTGGHIFLDTPVTAFAVSPQGRVIETESNGNLYSFDPLTGGHIFLDSPVTAFAVTPQGKVIETETNGNLYSFDPLTGGHIFLDSPVAAFAVSPQGRVIETETNGNLYSFDPVTGGHIFLDSPVTAFAVSPQGKVIETETNGNLYSFDPLTGNHCQLAGNVASFILTSGGSVVTVPMVSVANGVLYINGDPGNDTISVTVTGTVTFSGGVLTSDSRCFVVTYNGRSLLPPLPIGQVSKIVVHTGDGNNTVDLSAVPIPTEVYTGSGTNYVVGGSGGNFMVAGRGTNTFLGGDGNDVMVAGPTGNAMFDPDYNRTGGNDTYIVLGSGAWVENKYQWRVVHRADGSTVQVREDNKGCDQLQYNATFSNGQFTGFTTDHLDDNGFWSFVGQILPTVAETAAAFVGSVLTAGALTPLAGAAVGALESAIFQGINAAAYGTSFSWLSVGLAALGGGVGSALQGGGGAVAPDGTPLDLNLPTDPIPWSQIDVSQMYAANDSFWSNVSQATSVNSATLTNCGIPTVGGLVLGYGAGKVPGMVLGGIFMYWINPACPSIW